MIMGSQDQHRDLDPACEACGTSWSRCGAVWSQTREACCEGCVHDIPDDWVKPVHAGTPG
jgi:hypothetical protein